MQWPSADFIQAVGMALATVIGAVTAWQARVVAQLRQRIEVLEQQAEQDRGRFRASIKAIRALLRHIQDLESIILRRTGEAPPANPWLIPPELEEEL